MSSSKNRVPIVDKNGKATHVWKMDENGFNKVQRVAGAAAPTIQDTSKGMTDAMDDLWTQVQAAKRSVEMMNGLDKVEPAADNPARAAWDKEYKQAHSDLIDAAIGAGAYIEDLELELNVYEQMDSEDRDDDFEEDYNVAVTEIRFQKSELKGYLKEGGVLDSPNFLNSRVTRTWEDGVAAAKEIYGDNPSLVQELPNGSTTLRYESNPGAIGSDTGWREITINRLGNVTRFNREQGDFTAASIDFPVATPTGGMKLRGDGQENISMHDAQVIAYVSTGQKDTLIK